MQQNYNSNWPLSIKHVVSKPKANRMQVTNCMLLHAAGKLPVSELPHNDIWLTCSVGHRRLTTATAGRRWCRHHFNKLVMEFCSKHKSNFSQQWRAGVHCATTGSHVLQRAALQGVSMPEWCSCVSFQLQFILDTARFCKRQ